MAPDERRAGWSEYEAGQMQAKLAAAIEQLNQLAIRMDAQTMRIEEIDDRFKHGKAGLIGLIIGVGFMLVGIREMFEALFRRVVG